MRRGGSPRKEFRPLSHADNKKLTKSEELYYLDVDQSKSSSLEGGDIQPLTLHPRDLDKIHTPKPPKGHQKPVPMACVRKTKPAEEVTDAVRWPLTQPVDLDPDSEPLDYTEMEGLRFDDQGMVLPHSILGSLEDFRDYLEAKGETEVHEKNYLGGEDCRLQPAETSPMCQLVKRIPKSQRHNPSEAPRRHHTEAVQNERGISSGHRNIQSNALQHWHTQMTQRRRQQDFLSDHLDRPVENLLMNQANHFRETQEKREFLSQVMPLIHPGYGYRVGSEFWSLPQRYGDEMSGITATLTQTQQGRWEPVTHIGQPSSIRQESGIFVAETLRPASRTWEQSLYLKHQRQELGEVLQDMDIKKPDINGLEVIGSGKPFTSVTVCPSPLLDKEEEEAEHKMMKKENIDPQTQYDDVRLDALHIPALRFCGQLASWTGNSTTNQGEVGISATIFFEALTGDRASSHLELHNEGSTAIFYSWQQLPVPHSFPKLRSQTKNLHFYFNSSSGVIRPGDTQRVEFIFKSEEPGIKTELWQLLTHPLLLQGASMQVTLRGVALYQDKSADQKLFIETKLEKTVKVKMCWSIVYEMLQGVRTPERPSSPAELYVTEEQEFLSKNPKLQYLHQPVEDLKRLWQEVHPGHTWDLSVDTLQQVVLSLPKQESAQENSLTQLNSLLLQLSEPSQLKHRQLTATAIGQQLWRKLLDTMAGEAMWLRNLLGLPEKDTWINKKEEFLVSDPDMADSIDERSETKQGAAAEEQSNGSRSIFKDDNKGESKSATTEKSVEVRGRKESKKKGKRREEVGKRTREKQGKDSASLIDIPSDSISQQPPDGQGVGPEVMDIYTRLLHVKVYALMEDLVDNLCDLMDDLNEGNTEALHTQY
ncbi:MYCBP-associated protein isoform X3 [Epinephelus fuscoguttatus]|uniref:MYCBP-associated protein isoform X3 n=1 Tax=Epinephelus fuscoguttatus TaxID=293821 RepID=UPI0020D03BED|nr:MYCBP-associated protein isoform X3 [Epinephelus fuscoguttatus]